MPAWRRFAAIVAGVIGGGIVVSLIQMVSSLIYPPPEGLDLADQEQLANWIESLPVGAFVLVAVAHGMGATFGGMICAALIPVRWMIGPLIVGVLFLVLGIVNATMVPHPSWFLPIDLMLYLPCAWIGGLMPQRTSQN